MGRLSLVRGRLVMVCVAAAAVAGLLASHAAASETFGQATWTQSFSVRSHPAAALSSAALRTQAFERVLARSSAAAFANRTASPQAAERSSGDGIQLIAPANGLSLPDTAPVNFSWVEGWYCEGCDGVEVIIVASDPSLDNEVYTAAGACPASSSPSCPTSTSAGPFPAGTYYWAVGLKLGDNPVHVSDLWSFTVTHAGAPATPPTTPAPAAPVKAGSLAFSDASGDANGAPDISGVAVSNDANGQILMQINTPAATDIATDEAVLIFLDTDQNPATGDVESLGMEFLIVFDGASHQYFVGRWNGADFVSASAPTSSARYAGGAQISINRSDLEGLSGFNFWVRIVKGRDPSSPFDDAPDRGTWNYALGAGTAPPTTPTAPATQPATPQKTTVASIKVLALPAAPTAGLQFRILVPSVKLSTGQDVRPTTARCRAKLAGKTLAGRGAGRCTFTMPRGSGGASLSVTVTITYRGTTKSRTLTFRVRRP